MELINNYSKYDFKNLRFEEDDIVKEPFKKLFDYGIKLSKEKRQLGVSDLNRRSLYDEINKIANITFNIVRYSRKSLAKKLIDNDMEDLLINNNDILEGYQFCSDFYSLLFKTYNKILVRMIKDNLYLIIRRDQIKIQKELDEIMNTDYGYVDDYNFHSCEKDAPLDD